MTPYKLVHAGDSYKVVNSETGAVKAQHTSKARAERQVRLLHGIEHGWKPTGKKAES